VTLKNITFFLLATYFLNFLCTVKTYCRRVVVVGRIVAVAVVGGIVAVGHREIAVVYKEG